MDPAPNESLIDKARKHIDKILIVASGVAILIGGYVTLDYKSYTDCQVRILEAERATTRIFNQSMQTLLSQPPRPVEERRAAFIQLQRALQEQQRIQDEVGNCK